MTYLIAAGLAKGVWLGAQSICMDSISLLVSGTTTGSMNSHSMGLSVRLQLCGCV